MQPHQVKQPSDPGKRAAEHAVGSRGVRMLILSQLLMLVSFGLGWLWLLHRVVKQAHHTATQTGQTQLLVLGHQLTDGRASDTFIKRLERAHLLYSSNPDTHILLLGGITGRNQHSEAAVGRDYLSHKGIPAAHLHTEDRSRHTLENLRHARELMAKSPVLKPQAALLSSRYHLYRALTLARGLGLSVEPLAAEDTLSFNPKTLLSMMLEAYYLHWYWCGYYYSRLTNNRENLAKIR